MCPHIDQRGVNMGFDAGQYGPVFAMLISEKRLNPLDGGTPNAAVKGKLDALSADAAFAGQPIADRDMAQACISGVWLYHNYLDISHTISQDILTTTGSFWHGMMHRREPDYSNSKYWFNKVGSHPVYEDLRKEAARIAGAATGAPAFLTAQKAWDAAAFVDVCAEAQASGKGPLEALCREIQQREWELLFDYSYRKALGK